MNRQSNTYTIIYSIVLVLVVGVVLSVVYQALRPMQVENINNDTKRQILAAARIVPENGESIAELFTQHIKDSYLVDMAGNKADSSVDAFSVNVAAESKSRLQSVSFRSLNAPPTTASNTLSPYMEPDSGALSGAT